jgi:uridine kinase
MDAPQPLAAGKRPDDVAILAKNSLLARVSPQDLGDLLDRLDQVAITRDTVLVQQGERLDTLYFVLEGELGATRGRVELTPLGPGAHFGELALLGETRSPTTIVAHSIVRLARLSRSRFLTLSTSHPRVALHLVQALASTLGEQLSSMTDRVGLLLKQRSLPRRTSLSVKTPEGVVSVPPGTGVGALLLRSSGVIAATIDRKPVSLDAPLVSDGSVAALTQPTSKDA